MMVTEILADDSYGNLKSQEQCLIHASLVAVERYCHYSQQTTVLTCKMGVNDITNLIELL